MVQFWLYYLALSAPIEPLDVHRSNKFGRECQRGPVEVLTEFLRKDRELLWVHVCVLVPVRVHVRVYACVRVAYACRTSHHRRPFSHKKTEDFQEFHAANPYKPMAATECCSCMSQRGTSQPTGARRLRQLVHYPLDARHCSINYATAHVVWILFSSAARLARGIAPSAVHHSLSDVRHFSLLLCALYSAC
jgi:hypothetical protein